MMLQRHIRAIIGVYINKNIGEGGNIQRKNSEFQGLKSEIYKNNLKEYPSFKS